MLHPAIDTSLPFDTDAEPTGSQPAFHAVVHLVIPGVDEDGRPMDADAASEWISEALRERFLDWAFVPATDPETGEVGDLQEPISIQVCQPYIEGTFRSAG